MQPKMYSISEKSCENFDSIKGSVGSFFDVEQHNQIDIESDRKKQLSKSENP